ncbi:MAG: phospholipase D family protein [Gemmataceae bacterium]|nr:phospholipase D family protein [Gemmataceae bacterium]
MLWIEIATGFTGAFTLVFLVRAAMRQLGLMPHVAAYFSPKGGCQEAVVRELKRARREILVQAYSFTADPLTEALIEAKKRGVHVDILLDRSNEQERYSDLQVFLDQGLAPLIDATHAIAHNKVMIIDQRTIITGSYNFTNQAEADNAENLLIIKGNADLTRAYRQNFLGHKSHAKPAQVKQAAEGSAPARRVA